MARAEEVPSPSLRWEGGDKGGAGAAAAGEGGPSEEDEEEASEAVSVSSVTGTVLFLPGGILQDSVWFETF